MFPARRESAPHRHGAPSDALSPREPLSPFRYLMRARQLTPREILHRRRMIDVYASYLLARVTTN